MPRVLAFGDSNTWGWVPVAHGFPSTRYPDDQRWPGILEAQLGPDVRVEVDGLSARTIDLDDALDWDLVRGSALNGRTHLPAAIARALPLELAVVMLGTNDLRTDYRRQPEEIALSAIELARLAPRCTGVATSYPGPAVLLVCPPPLGHIPHPEQARFFDGRREASRALGHAMRAAARDAGIPFVDAGEAIPEAGGVDGVHLSGEDHRRLGVLLTEPVRRLLDRQTGHKQIPA